MHTAVTNKEMDKIRRLAGGFSRHPQQVNMMYEADAEIIRIAGKEDEFLVLKTDGIHEEIKEKLYTDPYLIGWMAVTAPVSDIAAVGATPTGILLSLVLSQQAENDWLDQLKAGITDACDQYKIFVLGGDTNFDDHFSVSATVVGNIHSRQPLLRKGMKPGDHLYATAYLGHGNAYAYSRFFDPTISISYQPVARLAESKLISRYASACMDTSDGLFPSLAVLSEINGIGFDMEVPLQQLLSAASIPVARQAQLPEWMFLAGPHGEYELVFSIPPERHSSFQMACENENWQPVYIGKAIEAKQLNFISGSMNVQCHPSTIANLFYGAGGKIPAYFDLLMQQHKRWNTERIFYEPKKPQSSNHSPEHEKQEAG